MSSRSKAPTALRPGSITSVALPSGHGRQFRTETGSRRPFAGGMRLGCPIKAPRCAKVVGIHDLRARHAIKHLHYPDWRSYGLADRGSGAAEDASETVTIRTRSGRDLADRRVCPRERSTGRCPAATETSGARLVKPGD